MCNDHEHYTSFSSNEHSNLCFKHAVVECIAGNHISIDVVTYELKTECDVCDTENLINFLDGKVLTKRSRATKKIQTVDRETIFSDFFDAGLKTTPANIMKVLNKGCPVGTPNYVYQYLDKGEL